MIHTTRTESLDDFYTGKLPIFVGLVLHTLFDSYANVDGSNLGAEKSNNAFCHQKQSLSAVRALNHIQMSLFEYRH